MSKQLIAIFFTLFLYLLSCSDNQARQQHFKQWMEPNGKIKVLSTTAMINDLVQAVGGEHIDALTLIQGDLDPHSYQLVKGDDEKLYIADVIFANGLGLEHGPSLQRYLNENEKTVPLGDLIVRQDRNTLILVDGQKDPHMWMDVSLWMRAIPFIVQILSQKDPVHATEYQMNGERLSRDLQDVHEQIYTLLHHIPAEQRFLVTSHDAFNYFTRAYLSENGEIQKGDWQKRFTAPEGLAPESQLSTSDIRAIIDHMDRYRIHVLFSESNVSRDSIKKIVQAGREKGLEMRLACCPLYADAMGPPGSEGDTYSKMMLYNAKMIALHLKGEHTQ